MNQAVIIMGVSGSGKTTVGQALAERLSCPFYDADDFHPPENVAKMARGLPLTDADRDPWLARLTVLVQNHVARGEGLALACSALKQSYRQRLQVSPLVRFVFLQGDFDLIWERMRNRDDHYMKPDMLRSQFEALEPPSPDEAIIVSIDQDVDKIVEMIARNL